MKTQRNSTFGSLMLRFQCLRQSAARPVMFAGLALAMAQHPALPAQSNTLGGAFPMYAALESSPSGSGQIAKIDSTGTATFITANLQEPVGVAVDAGNSLYVSDVGLAQIVKLDSSGNQTV